MNEVYNLIKDNLGFENPFEGDLDSLDDIINTNLLDQVTSPLYASFSPAEQISAAGASADFKNQVLLFRQHTRKLAGKELEGTRELMRVANAMATARNAEGELVCDSFLGAFGAIMKLAEITNDILGTLVAIQDFVNGVSTDINMYISNIQNQTTKFINQIAADVGAYATGLQNALMYGVSQALIGLAGDSCFGQVVGVIATQEMKKELDKITRERRQKLQKIAGIASKGAADIVAPLKVPKPGKILLNKVRQYV